MGQEMTPFMYQKPTQKFHQDNSTMFLTGMQKPDVLERTDRQMNCSV